MKNYLTKKELKPLTVETIAKMIERRVSYFNGWFVPEETMKKNCKEAAEAIFKAWNLRR